ALTDEASSLACLARIPPAPDSIDPVHPLPRADAQREINRREIGRSRVSPWVRVTLWSCHDGHSSRAQPQDAVPLRSPGHAGSARGAPAAGAALSDADPGVLAAHQSDRTLPQLAAGPVQQ